MLTRRILFVTCMALETPRSASMAFMQVLLEKYPESFVWYSLRSSKIGNTNPLNIPSSNSRDCLQFSRPRLLKNFLNLSLIAWVKGRQAAIFGKQHKVDVVMADLAFEAVVAGRVAAQVLAVPLLVSIHDDPVERIKVKGLPGWLIKWYERQFEETLRSASGCAVISDGMGEIYQQRYGVKTATLYVGVDENQCLPVRSGDSNGRPFIVGSTGSVNSAENWNMLLEAVRWLNQKHGEGSYRILHAGELRSQLKTSKDVEVTGWLPGIEFFHILARMDIGFLTWSFDNKFNAAGRTSFPLKIHSYLQAQIPMLAFGPPGSSIVRFVDENSCGISCTVLDAALLSERLERMRDEQEYRRYLPSVEKLKEKFSRRSFFDKFERYIDLATIP